MLLGDGSPTRHLQLLTKKETKVKLIGMDDKQLSIEDAPEEINQLKTPLIRRQVWIENDDMTLAWAESWWNIDQVRINLTNTKDPIWKNLTKDRSELFREVDAISIVEAPWLKIQFKSQGPFWSRNYRFFRNKKPLTIIREVFNPAIERWLGNGDIDKFSNLYSSST
ncbi:MAG: chorismate lyase [Prochlorococcus sp. SP3034]|nr:chorismate lyase [Prochlorococcus sp. SP3034]|tara:strand:+ start:278 stop:778 length:501 start_codon:yes stop_codon:yes gene_type:complete